MTTSTTLGDKWKQKIIERLENDSNVKSAIDCITQMIESTMNTSEVTVIQRLLPDDKVKPMNAMQLRYIEEYFKEQKIKMSIWNTINNRAHICIEGPI